MSLLLAAIVPFVGASVQSTAGFAMNAIAAPLLLSINPALVPAPLLMAHLALTLRMSAAEMRETDHQVLVWAMVGALPGIVIGAWLLGIFTVRQLTVSAVVVLAGASSSC